MTVVQEQSHYEINTKNGGFYNKKKVADETNDQIIKVFFLLIRKKIVYVEPADTKIVCRNNVYSVLKY